MQFNAIKLTIASPEEIGKWSYGEVLKPETINYRTQRPEKDGLFSERIFGPTKDYECYCGKYRKIRYKGIICDKCGVEVTRSLVRRKRMGHIKLAVPVSHVWFLRTVPSKIVLFFDAPLQKLEKVIYYAAYVIIEVNEENRKKILEELSAELKLRKKGARKTTIENLTNPTLKQVNLKEKELEKAALQTKEILTSLKPGVILNEAEYHNLARRFAELFEAGSGAEAIRKILEKINLKKAASDVEAELKEVKDVGRKRRLFYKLKLFRSFIRNNIRPEWMILTSLPVLPPDLRPMVALEGGRYATSDLNDLYRRVINRNNRLKKLLDLKAPEVIVINEKRMLQEAVDSLIDNTARPGAQQQLSSQRRPLKSLSDILKGKQGRFRQNLLGKRVDYSGRSVVVVGPKLKLNECGLPKGLALELFKPFVINKIIEREMAHNIRNANRLIEQASPEILEILEEVIINRWVLLNRAPTLHRLGIQAFKPILIEDLAIRIPPMVCAAFNADFDGDQMPVYLPLNKEAQNEAETRMASTLNILKPSTGDPITVPTQDIVLGNYYLTKIKQNAKGSGKIYSSSKEVFLAYELGYLEVNALIKLPNPKSAKFDLIQTTCGRLIFNDVLPEDFNFINEVLDKKTLQEIVADLINKYGIESIWKILDKIKDIGFEYATLSGITWGMTDLIIPLEKEKILEIAEKEMILINGQYKQGLLTGAERRMRAIGIWEKVGEKIAVIVPSATDPDGSVHAIVNSKARGSWAPIIQMTGIKGLVQNPKGETIELPIKSSYKEGLGVLEFFINTHGARKGLIDTALKTAQAGYLTRRLVDVSQDLITKEIDCQTVEGIKVNRFEQSDFGRPFSQRLFGRVSLENIKIDDKLIVKIGKIINRVEAEIIEKSKIEVIKVRSPITCKSLHGICSSCYGLDLGKNKLIDIGEAVGVVAAQSIGEPGTQLTMRTFHSGGVAGVDITHGLPRVEELFESRAPKGKAILAEIDGEIEDIEIKDGLKIIKIKAFNKSEKTTKKLKNFEYSVLRTTNIFVKINQLVKKGDQLCEGNIDPKELFDLKGREEVEHYIINEVQKIYTSEGTPVNDKHIEIIIKQMFSRMMIKESGDTDFIVGEIVEKSKFLKTNQSIKKSGKEPAKAKQLLMGITKVALSTESFLSAASFQETTRVLVTAASECRVDYLQGLKENVIIGRLIPTGTGYRNIEGD